jgi:hypothetical protein
MNFVLTSETLGISRFFREVMKSVSQKRETHGETHKNQWEFSIIS